MNTLNLPIELQSLHSTILEAPPYGYFPSTSALTKFMLKLARIKQLQRCYSRLLRGLEPSAGCGMLARAMRSRGIAVDVVELDPQLRDLLWLQGFSIIGSDFLKLPPMPAYNVILMNPPFSSPSQRGVVLIIFGTPIASCDIAIAFLLAYAAMGRSTIAVTFVLGGFDRS